MRFRLTETELTKFMILAIMNMFFFQIVVNTAGSFVYSVLSMYTYYQYFIQKDDYFRDLSWLHLQWQILFLTTTFMTIYTASSVSDEVSS